MLGYKKSLDWLVIENNLHSNMPPLTIIVIALAILTYVVAETVYADRCSQLYRYIRQNYPQKLDLFSSLSPGGLVEGFVSSRPPSNAKSMFNWRYLIRLRNTVQADPDLSRDIVLLGQFRGLRNLSMVEIAAVIVVIATLVTATFL